MVKMYSLTLCRGQKCVVTLRGTFFGVLSQWGYTFLFTTKGRKTMKKFICLVSVCMMIVVLAFYLSSCECKHELQEATCTTPRTCAKCGETFGTTSAHKYERVACGEYMRCKDCGANSNYSIAEHLYLGNCGEIGTCYYCKQQSPSTLEHNYKGDIHTGVIRCNNCYGTISEVDIQGKSTTELTGVERAYIYWHLNRYLTATTSYGSYMYTTDEAFKMVAQKFYLPKSYLEQDFWGVNSVYNHNFYSQYYYK